MALLTAYRRMWLQLCIGYYRLALQNIDPYHPDVPSIVRTLMELSEQLERLKGAA